MEEIRNILIEIATIFNKQQRYMVNEEFNNFMVNIKTANFSELSRYACDFLNRSLTLHRNTALPKTVMFLFEQLKTLYIQSVGNDNPKVYGNTDMLIRKFAEKRYISFLDSRFDRNFKSDISLTKQTFMFVPLDEIIPLVEELYREGAYTEEKCGSIHFQGQTMSAIVYYETGLNIYLNSYQVDKDSLIIYIFDNQTRNIKQFEVPLKAVKSYTKNAMSNISFLIPEISYLMALNSGTFVDFVELMEIKGKIKPKKLVKLMKSIKPFKEKGKEEKYGLQKTC